MTDDLRPCPHCGNPLEGLGTFCWACRKYKTGDPEPLDSPQAVEAPPARVTVKKKSQKEPPPLEVDIRTGAVNHLRVLGFYVYDLEQGYRPFECRHCGGNIGGGSRQTTGIGDVVVVGFGVEAWVEFKRPGEKQTDEQRTFGDAIVANGGIYLLWESVKEAADWADTIRNR